MKAILKSNSNLEVKSTPKKMIPPPCFPEGTCVQRRNWRCLSRYTGAILRPYMCNLRLRPKNENKNRRLPRASAPNSPSGVTIFDQVHMRN